MTSFFWFILGLKAKASSLFRRPKDPVATPSEQGSAGTCGSSVASSCPNFHVIFSTTSHTHTRQTLPRNYLRGRVKPLWEREVKKQVFLFQQPQVFLFRHLSQTLLQTL